MLVFDKGSLGRSGTYIPECDVPEIKLSQQDTRKFELCLPCLSENDVSRHYTEIASKVYGINNGFYPLGSCTMKYNPKADDAVAALKGFTAIHPLAPEDSIQGCLEVIYKAQKSLCAITGMHSMTLQPAAGAHGEYTGLLLIKSYHKMRGDEKRTKILIPDSAHGTNPASASMAGFDVINIPSGPDGCVSLDQLMAVCDDTIAGLMITNPNTLGLFDKNIDKITGIVHKCGGLCYYDGANLNAVMGIVRPGDIGFDCMHLNLHKTFATPHGGGGPGSGPVGCSKELSIFLPGKQVEYSDKTGLYSFFKAKDSIGDMRSFYGNFLVIVRALTYIMILGKEGIPEASSHAVLNANYMMSALKEIYPMAYDDICMHEFVMSLENIKKQTGCTALDIAKGLLDEGIHPPTMYFPMIIHEALMIEPCETEPKEVMDEAVESLKKLKLLAFNNPERLKTAPHKTIVTRLDEVAAARNPILRWTRGL